MCAHVTTPRLGRLRGDKSAQNKFGTLAAATRFNSGVVSYMSLSLPEDAEPFLRSDDDFSQLHAGAAYALTLSKPADLTAEWDRHFDERPDYWDQLDDAERVVYVGGSKDLLARLEDHRDGEVRQTALTTVCEIGELRNVWWADSGDPFLVETQLADLLAQELPPTTYVHQR